MGVYIRNITKEQFIEDCNAMGILVITEGISEIDLVRCGECKWCDDKGKGRALICTNPYIDMDIHPLDFCSYGERETEDFNPYQGERDRDENGEIY